jgi:FtsP/CotA-like multicopper oxidase with cupredoxin domain
MGLTRRELLIGCGLTAAGMAGGLSVGLAGRATAAAPDMVIAPQPARFALVPGAVTDVLSYAPDAPPPVIRIRQGEVFVAELDNRLDERTTIHWHGLRVPNAMDGVPYLTQPPVEPGERFRYAFTPPDAGTFWYHPHCNTLEQMGHGLTGVLVVEEAEDPGFDAEVVLNLRDFRLGDDGRFLPPSIPRQAARAGTFGTVLTANWRQAPVHDAPAGGLVRLRLAATDVTRIYRLRMTGGEAEAIALDGNPAPTPFALPDDFLLGPGQRLDLAVRMPDGEGEEAALATLAGNRLVTLARLRATGASLGRSLAELAPLPPNPVPEPDLSAAETLAFEFSATADTADRPSVCGTPGYTFWAINRQAWPGDMPDPGAPLVVLRLGRSYVLSLSNRTPHMHPIHLHGMSFRLLHSNRRELLPLVTDTALLLPDERVDVALVADNPGDWVFHCHIIEHQKTGMTGFIRVE